jgi:TRAP-type mannitol/chloroaromatic compound transport system permease large subunit
LKLYRNLVAVLAGVFVVLGVALIVATAREGGGVGYLLGALFVALGLGRFYLLRRRR